VSSAAGDQVSKLSGSFNVLQSFFLEGLIRCYDVGIASEYEVWPAIFDFLFTLDHISVGIGEV
jgi:hypothetical protein